MTRTTEPLACPICGQPTDIYDSRPEGTRIRRRRRCKLGHRFNTTEVIVGPVDSPQHAEAVARSLRVDYDDSVVESDLRAERGW
jgi:transcriptional regulator NrdR family protein